MSSEKKIKFGVFGIGGRGTYLKNIAESLGFELVAVCDINPANLER